MVIEGIDRLVYRKETQPQGEEMIRTALALTAEEWGAYQPGAKTDEEQVAERWDRAWDVARTAASLLRQRFGATRVVVFGSLAHRAWFTPWSDIDLAAWGIPPDAFYRAVAFVTGLSPEFEVDLVAPEDCRPALCQVIEREGIDL
jgi:predicted nucleotidyltransferase